MTPAYILKSPVASSAPGLGTLVRDPLLQGVANDGVRFIADLAFPYSYPGGALFGRPAAAPPSDQAAVFDVADHAAGKVVKAAGQTVGYAGGGFDYSTLTARASYLEIPAAIADDIWTAYAGASQQFLACLYVRLPALADWNANANLAPFIQFANSRYVEDVDIFTLGQTNIPTILMSRQTAGATVQSLSVNPTGHYGLVAQLAVWRTASECGLRLKSSAGTVVATAAAGSANSGNFSGNVGKVGLGGGFWQNPLGTQATAVRWRLYRVFVENLARSGRAPLSVLDADYSRVVARAVFS